MDKMLTYPKLVPVGSKHTDGLFDGEVCIEEKVDGVQYSFGVFDGELRYFGKGGVELDEPREEYISSIYDKLVPGWLYVCEHLDNRKQAELCYARAPKNYLVLIDVLYADGDYASYYGKKATAWYLGINCVPLLYRGIIDGVDMLHSFLKTISFLGGTLIEGVVAKNYGHSPPIFGKYKSNKYIEVLAERAFE